MMNIKLHCAMVLLGLSVVLSCSRNKGTQVTYVPDPVASFTQSGQTVAPATIVFHNGSQYADLYLWRFGDGDSSIVTNPTHIYEACGDYPVSLTATNSSTNKSDTLTRSLLIEPQRVFISSIIIDEMPFTDLNGNPWDLYSGPDVYPDLGSLSGAVFSMRSSYIADVEPADLPIQWDLEEEFEIPDWDMMYFINIRDYDGSGDDFIGSSGGYRINGIILTDGYPTVVQQQNREQTITTTIIFRWE